MVIKIYAPAPSVSSALEYNERKVAEGKASAISSKKIDDLRNPMATFKRYEDGSVRCEKMSFHASVNPSVTDKIPPERIPEFVREYMEKMGYGNQPYVLYKHIDTGRDHYHIVSVRVDENGRKIQDFRERKRSQQVMKELAEKYGYEIGKSKKKKEGETPDSGKETNPYEGFQPSAGEYGKQIERIADLAMTYHFTNARQFEVVMESLGVKVVPQEDGSVGFIGLDPKTGKPVTAVIKDPGIRYPTMDAIEAHAKACKGKIKTREKQRVANISKTALAKCRTEQHFRRYLAKSGIFVQFAKRADGAIFGVTFVDHHNKCCFKASELPGLKASMFESARQGVWTLNEHCDEKEKATTSEIADIAIAAVGAERSRRNEDEEIMRRGRKGPNQ